MLPYLAITLTRTLADDPRNQLEFWLEEAATAARGMCSEHDFSGALTLAATDRVWAAYPGNVTNFVDVIANGDAPQIRARPTWNLPNALDAAASAAEVVIWRQATDRNHAYNVAGTRLSAALLASIGEANRTHLQSVLPGIALYALLPRQVIDAMVARHGILTSDDVNRLRLPLSSPLTSLADLLTHQEKYLLASQRLTRNGQGETPFKYFEMYLETLKGFPLVLHSMTPYYAANPGIQTQNLGTLFPFLEGMHQFLLKTNPSSPFSGAVVKPNSNPRTQRKDNRRMPKPANARPNAPRGTRMGWGPRGPTALHASSSVEDAPTPDPYFSSSAYLARIDALTARIASMEAH